MLAFRKNDFRRLATLAAATLLAAGLGGCGSGADGVAAQAPGGGAGPTGPGGGGSPGNGPVAHISTAAYVVPVVTGARISTAPAVDFQLQNRDGTVLYRGATLSGNGMRFVLSQLAAPAAPGGSSTWTQLADEVATGAGANPGTLIDRGDGRYTYTYSTDVAADARYAASSTTRVGFQLGGPEAGNGLYTWQIGRAHV